MSTCKACGAPVVWTKESGRWKCFNPGTTTDHWDACSQRRWAQVKATGERFENDLLVTRSPQDHGETCDGYADSVHGTKLSRISSGVKRGRLYRGGCTCDMPPWEDACEKCPARIAS